MRPLTTIRRNPIVVVAAWLIFASLFLVSIQRVSAQQKADQEQKLQEPAKQVIYGWPVPHTADGALQYYDRQPHHQHWHAEASQTMNCSSCHTSSGSKLLSGYQDDAFAFGFALRDAEPVLRRALKLAENQGVVIESVQAGSPAEKSGFESADVIAQVDGKPIGERAALQKLFASVETQRIEFELYREGERVKKAFEIGKFRDDVLYQFRIGVNLTPLTPAVRAQLDLDDEEGTEKGIMVQEVVDDFPAKEAGIQRFDIVLIAGKKPIASAQDLTDAVRVSKDKPMTLTILRKNKKVKIKVAPKRERVTDSTSLRFGIMSRATGFPDAVDFKVKNIEQRRRLEIDILEKALQSETEAGALSGFSGAAIANIDEDGKVDIFVAGSGEDEESGDAESKKLDEVLKQLKKLEATIETLKSK